MFRRFPPSSARSTAALALALLAGGACLLAPSRAAAVAVAVGTNGISVSSSNAGASWNSPNTINAGVSFAGVWMTSDANGVAVGNGNSIYRTTSGGTNWSLVSSPITTTYNDVMFPTAATGYIAATNGQVLKSTNSGTSWTAQSTGAVGSLLAIHFVSATQGCAVGINGAITRTTNGGTSWIDETTGASTLNDVFFFDANNGWAVGNGGTILRSTNGGDTWAAVTSGTTIDIAAVWFTSATLGFVCGGDRVLRRTTNGGTSWSAVTLPTTQVQSGLFDLMFADPDTGVVVGSGVSAYRTIDGGTTWTVANPDPTANEVLQAVHLGRPPGPPPQITVNVNAIPAGRSFRVDGQTFTSAQVFTWDAGSSHQLEGVTPQTISAGERYVFLAWSGGSTSTGSSITVTPATGTSFTANYQRQFLLTMNTETGGTVTPTAWRNAGSVVQIAATEGTGYDFDGWVGSGSGSYTGTNNPASVTMNGPITQAGNFVPVAITLTFQTNPTGRNVIVDGTTWTTPYVLQTTADISHTLGVPSPQGEAGGTRLAFQSWSDGGAQSHTIDPLVSTTYTSTFKTQHFLDVVLNPVTGGTMAPGDGWHDAGASVTLTPTANLGYAYYLMSGSGSGSFTGLSDDATPRVTMNGPITQTAYFSNATMRTVTLVANPPGPDLMVGTVDAGSNKRFVWPSGQSLQISAPSTQVALASVKRWQWTRWSQGGARTQTVTPTANVTYTAHFDVQFELEMLAEPGGTTSPSVGESWVDSNTVVTITALPDANHSFMSWSGTGSSAYSGSNNPAQFTIRGKVNELARFDLLPFVTLDPSIAGRSFVAGEPETIRWDANFASTTPCQLQYKWSLASTWISIGSATPQTKMLVWTPPDAPQTSLQMRLLWPVNVASGDTLAGTFRICDPYFAAATAITGLGAGVRANDIAAGDMNGDGVADLVFGLGTPLVAVRTGLAGAPGVGTGGFNPATTAPTGALGVANLELGDLDRDGRLDVVASIIATNDLRRWAGNGDGTLDPPVVVDVNGQLADFALADVTEDGVLDIVGVGVGVAGRLCVSRANTTNGVFTGTFTPLPDVPTIDNPEAIQLADLNRDGILDVVVLGETPDRLAVHFGAQGPRPGSGSFGAPRTADVAGALNGVELADFDGNGRLDALVIDFGGGPQVALADFGARGENGLLFARRDTVTTDGPFQMAQVGDFDRDGHVDIAFARRTLGGARLYRGIGDGSFEFMTAQASGAAALDEMLVHDLVEDGRADLLLIPEDAAMTLRVGDLAACGGSAGAVFLDAPDAAGLAFPIGAEMPIAWRRFQSAEAVDLELSRDSGQTWESIARNVVHSPVSWTVTPPATEGGMVRVRPTNGSHLSDRSTNKFAILAPSVDVPGGETVPTIAAFAAPWPNPGRGSTHFRLALPHDAVPHVALYDVAGRRIRLLHEGALPAGDHALAWDGRDDGGREVGAGVYFARAGWEGFRAERRVVRLD